MKKIFLYLLNKYTRNEKGRLFIFNYLHGKVIDEYSEQTTFGNVYNSYIEFIISNDTIKYFVKNNDTGSIHTIKRGLHNDFENAIKIIRDEKI